MADNRGEVYLIDGSSYVHRAYHAIKGLSTSRGIPSNAVFGFTKMLLKVLREKSPSLMAVVFDAKGPTFRHAIYPAYKANRPPMPEDLAAQIPYIKKVVKALNIPTFEMEGYEADDIMGTLAARLSAKGRRVIMVTGDKDFRQLVSPLLVLWDSMKDKVTDYDEIKRAYGIEPEAFVDVMALSGDATDNIPGVEGIGEKTALELIRRYGSLDGLFNNIDALDKKKLAAKIRESKDVISLSRQLVTIDRAVPLSFSEESLAVGEADKEALASLFKELEFKSLWEEFAPKTDEDSECITAETSEEFNDWLGQEAGKVAISLDESGICLAAKGKSACFVPFREAVSHQGELKQVLLKDACTVLESQEIGKIGHDLKAQARALSLKGIEMRGIFFDTMLASYVVNPGLKDQSLQAVCGQYLGERPPDPPAIAEGKEAFAHFSCRKASLVLKGMESLADRLRQDGNEGLFFDLEMRLLPVLLEMELLGIRIDADYLRNVAALFEEKIAALAAEIFDKAGCSFNINSPKQLAEVLFDRLGLPAQGLSKKTRKQSTDYEALRRLASVHPLPDLVLRFRSATKLKSTYLDGLLALLNPATGRIHTTFNQAVTATGRLSSSNPNLQNIPARGEEASIIRKGFIPSEGCEFMSADYSQVELRIFAHLSGDTGLMEAFRRGEDIHRRTAADLLGVEPDAVTPEMRRIAKAVNFGIIYGMGGQRLARELDITLEEAKHYISAYYSRYPGVQAFREEMITKARTYGYVTTLSNRRRYLPEINNENGAVRAEAERMAVNTPVQGTAADIIKKAMISIHGSLRERGLKSRMILQVHDELLLEVAEGERQEVSQLVKRVMEGAASLSVPLVVEVKYGQNWADAH
jgi:DNA polymerase-1